MSIRKVAKISLKNFYQTKIQASRFVNISHKFDIPNPKVREYRITQVHISYEVLVIDLLETFSSTYQVVSKI